MRIRPHAETSRCRGFTLVELMVVVAIIGVLGVVAMFSLFRFMSAPSAGGLARNIQFTMMRARSEASGDNAQRRLSCSPTACTYQVATTTGMGTPTGWNDVDTIASGHHATVWNVTSTTDHAANNSGIQMSGTSAITFFPNGSATAATVYVADTTSSSAPGNQYKIYVYPGTSMARLVSNW